MANEITFNAALAISIAGVSLSGSGSKSVSIAGNNYFAQVQNIGLATEALDLGDLTTPGYLFLKNADPTNFVQIGLTTPVTAGNAMVKLLPGEFALIPTRQTVIYALADTGTVDLQVVLTEL
jgi:hypothetical protein